MWLIRTKLEPPAPTERLVPRQRLRRRLPAMLRARLALVHAPAGFGKTCLLAEWQRNLAAQRMQTAWLTLDEQDSEPLQFLAYFTAALSAAGVEVGHLGPAAERGFPDVPISSLIAALNESVQRSRRRTVVFLDDYQRVSGGAVDRTLLHLIQTLGSRVTFLVAGRECPGFVASDPALRAGCVEIAGAELRFTVEETRALMERSSGAVPDEELEHIVARTDGWPIALAAVRDWRASGWSARRIRDSLAHPAADLRRYITREILRSLDAAEHEFLSRTAVVDRFSERLAHTLCPDLPVRESIAGLERKDLLVVIWDGDERWFRHHRVLAELAVAALEESRAALLDELHRLAAEWFFASGHHAEAVRHAVAVRDDRLLARLFEQAGGWKLVITGHVGLTRNALTLIAPEVLRDYPRAQLARILLLAKQGNVDEARSQYEALRAMHLPADELLGAEAAIIAACIDRYEDAPVDADGCATFAAIAERVPAEHAVIHATHANVLCTLQYELGDLDRALTTADSAVAHYRRMSSIFGEIFVYIHQGHALLEMGRLRDAEATLRQAWSLARDTTGPNTETEAIAATMLAAAMYECGELDSAEKLLSGAVEAIESGESWFDVLATAYATAASLAAHHSGTAAVLEIARRARHTAERRRIERLTRFADLIEVNGRIASASLSAAEMAPLEAALAAGLARERAPRTRLRMSLALSRLALARGYATIAQTTASAVAAESRALRHGRVCIEAHLLEALAAHASSDYEAAHVAFDAAVNLAMHEGFLQVFCDFGGALTRLVETRDQSAPDARSPRVRDRFLAAVGERLRLREQDSSAEGFSDRERAVLRLLAEGLSNKAIARALRVSENTVKFHLKNIFAKLGVTTRSEAAHRAQLHAD